METMTIKYEHLEIELGDLIREQVQQGNLMLSNVGKDLMLTEEVTFKL